MSKFLKNFDLERFDDESSVERIKRKPQQVNHKRKSKTNKPKREKSEE